MLKRPAYFPVFLAKNIFTLFIYSGEINFMKIYNITPINTKRAYYTHSTTNRKSPTNNEISNNYHTALPSTQQYLVSFNGGYSIDLAKTIERLDILAEKKPSIYPPHIREWAGMILEEGNKAKETLISIHKKFYSSLKDCFSIAEVKKKFPEFKDVLSDNEVDFSKGTIFESFKNGELEFFDKDEDLSLQLLKLYWGEGFSLNDLKKYTNGKDLYYTIKKFNIPTVEREYGHVLKLSDPEYNERLTKEMTAKRLESLDRRAQKADGEPVYIKRGPMSKEQKEHISQALLKFYRENPERLLQMSERQKEFYRENPEQAEIISRVAKKAWNVFGADRIKTAMSKFMKEKGFKDFTPKELENPLGISKPKLSAMKQFWAANEWARKSFSKNMEYAWKKVKQENNTFITVNQIPEKLKLKITAWAQQKGITAENLNFDNLVNKYTNVVIQDENSSRIVTKFADCHLLESDIMASTYFSTIAIFANKMKETINLRKANEEEKLFLKALDLIHRSMFTQKDGEFIPKVYQTNEVQALYLKVANYMLNNNLDKYIPELNKILNEEYEYISEQVATNPLLKKY